MIDINNNYFLDLTKIELLNGLLINKVANFYTTNKPLNRIDNTPLLSGDRWYNPLTRIQAVWNGTYWLGPYYYVGANSLFGNLPVSTNFNISLGIHIIPNIFVEHFLYQLQGNIYSGVLNNSNKFDYHLYFQSATPIKLLTVDTFENVNLTSATNFNVNTAMFTSGNPGAFMRITMANIIGSPQLNSPAANIQYGIGFRPIIQ